MLRLSFLIASLLVVSSAAAAGHRAPHAADRLPNLGGLWTSTSLTELERPSRFKALTASDAEARAYEQRRPEDFSNTDIDDVGGRQTEATFWDVGALLARIGGQARTSWIVDPLDGRLPYTEAGLAVRAAKTKATQDFSNPEGRTPSERCLISGWAAAGPPMLNGPYANEYQFVQTKDAVAIHMESVHDVRIGRWEGNSLVVETTNFNPGDTFKTPINLYISTDAKLTERFTRISPTQMLYEFTVDDPQIYSKPWRAQMIFKASKGPLLEYACHEGNYSLPGILAGARRQEAEAKVTK